MTKPMPPLNFYIQVEDPRVQQLIVQVWRRLPPHDRAVLRALVSEVWDHEGQDNVLGSVSQIDPPSVYNGNAGDVAIDLYRTVNLGVGKSTASDAACQFVIAHEFAHVVLRHSQIATVVSSLDGIDPPIHPDDDVEQLKRWHEEEADLQCWAWGFQDEMRAFLAEYPNALKPRWFQDITTEPMA